VAKSGNESASGGTCTAGWRHSGAALGLSYDQLTASLDGACYDVYLSDVAYCAYVTIPFRPLSRVALSAATR